MSESNQLHVHDVLETLSHVMQSSESDAARIQAAKILLERLAQKEDDDGRKLENEERAAALDKARELLAEFAALKLASLCQPDTLAASGTAATDHATDG